MLQLNHCVFKYFGLYVLLYIVCYSENSRSRCREHQDDAQIQGEGGLEIPMVKKTRFEVAHGMGYATPGHPLLASVLKRSAYGR
jgi:hypothetical protein